jgi:hypothetical protein
MAESLGASPRITCPNNNSARGAGDSGFVTAVARIESDRFSVDALLGCPSGGVATGY